MADFELKQFKKLLVTSVCDDYLFLSGQYSKLKADPHAKWWGKILAGDIIDNIPWDNVVPEERGVNQQLEKLLLISKRIEMAFRGRGAAYKSAFRNWYSVKDKDTREAILFNQGLYATVLILIIACIDDVLADNPMGIFYNKLIRTLNIYFKHLNSMGRHLQSPTLTKLQTTAVKRAQGSKSDRAPVGTSAETREALKASLLDDTHRKALFLYYQSTRPIMQIMRLIQPDIENGTMFINSMSLDQLEEHRKVSKEAQNKSETEKAKILGGLPKSMSPAKMRNFPGAKTVAGADQGNVVMVEDGAGKLISLALDLSSSDGFERAAEFQRKAQAQGIHIGVAWDDADKVFNFLCSTKTNIRFGANTTVGEYYGFIGDTGSAGHHQSAQVAL